MFCLHLDLEGRPLLHCLLVESLKLVARVVAAEHDLSDLKADAFTELNELGVLVEAVELARVVHKLFIAVGIEIINNDKFG